MNGLGARLLSKMGWTEGTGLGAKRDGMIEPISVKQRKDNSGVGVKRKQFEDAWWERVMEEAYGKGDAKKGEVDLLRACEGRRCRPHGSAKLARIEAQDRKRRDEEGEREGVKLEENIKTRREGVRKLRIGKKRRREGKVSKRSFEMRETTT